MILSIIYIVTDCFNRIFDCSIRVPYNGNHPRKKSFANFANLEAFANVFLHFLSQPEFLYNEIT